MDNRISDIRKQIRGLRVSMLEAEAIMRDQINRDQNCAFVAGDILKMRTVMSVLVRERTALGDREPILVNSFFLPRDAADDVRCNSSGMSSPPPHLQRSSTLRGGHKRAAHRPNGDWPRRRSEARQEEAVHENRLAVAEPGPLPNQHAHHRAHLQDLPCHE